MLKLLLRKLIQGVMLILIASAVTFALLSSAGGDAFSSLRDNPQISAQTIENLRHVYGLDQPVAVRYATWLGNALRGELGESFYFRTQVSGLVFTRLTSTFFLSIAALFIALTIAVAFSMLSARYKWKWISRVIELVILLSASAPRLVLALVALAVMVRLAMLPVFWLAAFVLAIPLIAVFLAQLNNELKQTMKEDFIQLARAKGLSERVVIFRHAIRAALNPVLTIFGLSLGSLLGGSVIVETVLGRPGLGSLMITAVRARDIPLLMGIVLLTSAAVWLGNTLAEFLQMLNDKRLLDAETK